MILSDGEKQLILWTKGYFNLSEMINGNGYWNRSHIDVLLANVFNIEVDEVGFAKRFLFVKKLFYKLKENKNIVIDDERKFLLDLYANKKKQFDIFLSLLSSSYFEDNSELGMPDLSIYEK